MRLKKTVGIREVGVIQEILEAGRVRGHISVISVPGVHSPKQVLIAGKDLSYGHLRAQKIKDQRSEVLLERGKYGKQCKTRDTVGDHFGMILCCKILQS